MRKPTKSLLKFIGLILLTAGLALSALSVNAAEYRVRFGIMALTPYGYYDKNGKPQGDLFSITKAIVSEGNFSQKVAIQPMKRLTQSLLVKQELDCSLFGDVPYIRTNYTLIESTGIDVNFGVLPVKNIHIGEYADLSSLRIGVPLGISIGNPFDSDLSLNKVQAKGHESGMLMLKHRRFDALAGVISSLQFAGQINGVTSEYYGEPFITKQVPIWVVCRPGFADKSLTEKIRKTVIKLRENGTIQQIFTDYRKKQ